MVKLDIGCAQHKLPGYIGVDLFPAPGVDVLADFHSLPFADSSVDEIHTRHTLEHVADPLPCIAEMFRVCKPTGTITVIVPHYSNGAYWADLTHRRAFSVRSFEYYDRRWAKAAGFPEYLPEVDLVTRRVLLTYWPRRIYRRKSAGKRLLLATVDFLLSGLANLSPFLCERLWCGWVGGFYEVTFVLQPRKVSGPRSTRVGNGEG